MTIAEALASIKTTIKKIETKRAFVLQNALRDSRLIDPLLSAGGTKHAIARELQAIADLEAHIVEMRRKIQAANMSNSLAIAGLTMTVQEWLTWRREIVQGRTTFYRQLASAPGRVADDLRKKYSANDPQRPELEIGTDTAAIQAELERLETITGELDGRLSVFNATVTV